MGRLVGSGLCVQAQLSVLCDSTNGYLPYYRFTRPFGKSSAEEAMPKVASLQFTHHTAGQGMGAKLHRGRAPSALQERRPIHQRLRRQRSHRMPPSPE